MSTDMSQAVLRENKFSKIETTGIEAPVVLEFTRTMPESGAGCPFLLPSIPYYLMSANDRALLRNVSHSKQVEIWKKYVPDPRTIERGIIPLVLNFDLERQVAIVPNETQLKEAYMDLLREHQRLMSYKGWKGPSGDFEDPDPSFWAPDDTKMRDARKPILDLLQFGRAAQEAVSEIYCFEDEELVWGPERWQMWGDKDDVWLTRSRTPFDDWVIYQWHSLRNQVVAQNKQYEAAGFHRIKRLVISREYINGLATEKGRVGSLNAIDEFFTKTSFWALESVKLLIDPPEARDKYADIIKVYPYVDAEMGNPLEYAKLKINTLPPRDMQQAIQDYKVLIGNKVVTWVELQGGVRPAVELLNTHWTLSKKASAQRREAARTKIMSSKANEPEAQKLGLAQSKADVDINADVDADADADAEAHSRLEDPDAEHTSPKQYGQHTDMPASDMASLQTLRTTPKKFRTAVDQRSETVGKIQRNLEGGASHDSRSLLPILEDSRETQSEIENPIGLEGEEKAVEMRRVTRLEHVDPNNTKGKSKAVEQHSKDDEEAEGPREPKIKEEASEEHGGKQRLGEGLTEFELERTLPAMPSVKVDEGSSPVLPEGLAEKRKRTFAERASYGSSK